MQRLTDDAGSARESRPATNEDPCPVDPRHGEYRRSRQPHQAVAELLAVAAAVCFAAGSITIKRATSTPNVLTDFVMGLLTSSLSLLVLAFILVDSWSMSGATIGYFAIGGLMGSAVGRALNMWAVRDVGASVAVPVQSSAAPLAATAAGIVLFGEAFDRYRIIALALILTGIWLCIRGGSANRPGLNQPSRRRLSWATAVPIAAGLAFGSADTLRKFGVELGGEPIMGALVGTGAATAAWFVILLTSRRLAPVRWTRSLGWFCLNGLLLAAAQVFVLLALRAGDLSVVSAILASQPVIIVVLGALVLRDVEKLRVGTVVGAAVVCAGVVTLVAL